MRVCLYVYVYVYIYVYIYIYTYTYTNTFTYIYIWHDHKDIIRHPYFEYQPLYQLYAPNCVVFHYLRNYTKSDIAMWSAYIL